MFDGAVIERSIAGLQFRVKAKGARNELVMKVDLRCQDAILDDATDKRMNEVVQEDG